jgi:hypothetical protein
MIACATRLVAFAVATAFLFAGLSVLSASAQTTLRVPVTPIERVIVIK